MKQFFGPSTRARCQAWVACGLTVVLLGGAVQAQNMPAYQPMAAQQAEFQPGHMASPLAGGPSAARGDQFVDVYGNPIVVQAQYAAPCSGGCYPGAAPMGAYGDPMMVDFGGYAEDQIGPHYYDVSFGAVALKSDDLAGGIGPLAARNAGGVRELDPSSSTNDYSVGWQIALRYDLGALSVFEATYMGLYDMNFTESINSTQLNGVNNQLQTVWSNFGVPFPIDGLDDGETYTTNYRSDLQSTELSYRRYWVGNNPRVSGTYLLGFRYLRLTEDLNFDAEALLGNSMLNWGGSNDLVGFQIGGDGWIGLRQGMRLGCETKAGVYNNRFEFGANGDFAEIVTAPDDFTAAGDGNQVAFIGEFGVNLVIDILPSWSLRGGWQMLYIDNIASVGTNVATGTAPSFIPATFQAKDDVLYHGFTAGCEYVW